MTSSAILSLVGGLALLAILLLLSSAGFMYSHYVATSFDKQIFTPKIEVLNVKETFSDKNLERVKSIVREFVKSKFGEDPDVVYLLDCNSGLCDVVTILVKGEKEGLVANLLANESQVVNFKIMTFKPSKSKGSLDARLGNVSNSENACTQRAELAGYEDYEVSYVEGFADVLEVWISTEPTYTGYYIYKVKGGTICVAKSRIGLKLWEIAAMGLFYVAYNPKLDAGYVLAVYDNGSYAKTYVPFWRYENFNVRTEHGPYDLWGRVYASADFILEIGGITWQQVRASAWYTVWYDTHYEGGCGGL